MKRSTLKLLLSVAAMGLAASASADLLYTFDTGAGIASTAGIPEAGGSFAGNFVWDSTYQAVQHKVTGSNQGGWTLGGSDNMQMDFNWPVQSTMQGFDAAHGVISFDLILNDNSWDWATGAGWGLQFNVAGNSGGAGWTQVGLTDNNNDGGFAIFKNGTYHYDLSFQTLGWTGASSWYQLYFGANSGSTDGIGFYIDNISVTPEPATFALMGLGAAALLIFRRR